MPTNWRMNDVLVPVQSVR